MNFLPIFLIFIVINSSMAQLKILAGKPAQEGRYPFMASIQIKENPPQLKHHCGGAIINKKYVLTAAHCLFNSNTEQYFPANTLGVYVGSTKLFPSTSGTFYEVSKFIVHPDYIDQGFWKADNDLALIELKNELEYSEKVSCIRLARYSHLGTYFKATTMGWGLNELNELVNELKYLDGTGYNLRGKKIYFKGATSFSGVATGDSGGPLVVGNNRYLVGVLNGYFYNIWTKTAFYTSIPNYLSWLAEYVSNDPCIPNQNENPSPIRESLTTTISSADEY